MTPAATRENSQLVDQIKARISSSNDGVITFYDYMQLSLYHPEYGYYMKESPKVGKDGDFYTSSYIGTLMGEMLAVAFAEYWGQFPPIREYLVVEWGGGTGRLAGQILDELKSAYPLIYEKLRYQIVDTSAYHRGLQLQTGNQHGDQLEIASPAEWEKHHQTLPERTIVISNELLDAFPVHRFQYKHGSLHEVFIGWDDEQARFGERLIQTEGAYSFVPQLDRIAGRMVEGQQIEFNPHAGEWIAGIARKLQSGMIITIDYGDLAEKLYTPSRMKGTLMCYFRHQGHDNPYVNIGEQDITAHVNFTSCIEAGEAAGVSDWKFETQREFLMRHGILNRMQNHTELDPFHPVVKRNRAIRQLLIGDSMAEVFKVLTQKKGD